MDPTIDNLDTDAAFMKFTEIINKQMDIHAPEKIITIPSKNIIREKWMTKGLLKSSQQCEKLYIKAIKNLKQT